MLCTLSTSVQSSFCLQTYKSKTSFFPIPFPINPISQSHQKNFEDWDRCSNEEIQKPHLRFLTNGTRNWQRQLITIILRNGLTKWKYWVRWCESLQSGKLIIQLKSTRERLDWLNPDFDFFFFFLVARWNMENGFYSGWKNSSFLSEIIGFPGLKVRQGTWRG
jgi:hypothetical protein